MSGAGSRSECLRQRRLVAHTLEGQYPDCEAAMKTFRDQYCYSFTVERDVRYLLEIVRAIPSSQVRFHLASATTPTLIQPESISEGLSLEAEYILAPLG